MHPQLEAFVEVVRRGFEVWNAGDMDALREQVFDPGVSMSRAVQYFLKQYTFAH